MSKSAIHGRQLAARSLVLVALTSLVALAGHSGGRPALSDGGNPVNASKPADRAVSSLATNLDRAPQALGTLPLHFAGKRGSLYSPVGTSAGGGRFAAAGKTASAKTQESVRILKQRGQYESLRAAVEKSRYRVEESTRASGSAGAYIASNHAQNFRTEFTKTGASVEPSSSDRPRWRWKLRLTGYGYGETLRPLSKTRMTSADNRVEYRYRVRPSSSGKGKIRSTPPSEANGGERAALTEWYVNDARGVEHGFTLYSPPARARKGSSSTAISANARPAVPPGPTVRQEAPAPDSEFLHLTLDVSGNLQGRMIEEGEAIQFVTPDGTPVLGYRDLHAYDSAGRALPARLSLKGERLSVMIDDRTAVYPVTIDPLIFSKTRLTASDRAELDFFGRSVAVDGDTVVVGASGDAYVFVRSGTSWIQQAKLNASDRPDRFGWSVSVDGDTVVVADPGYDTAPGTYEGTDVGSAYIFVRRGIGFWFQQAKLTPSDAGGFDEFGDSVSVDGNTVVIGALHHAPVPTGGSAYVFVRDGTTWSQQAKFTSGLKDLFGNSVSLDGDTVAVGAPFDVVATGSAYVFVRVGTSWSQQAKLTASDGAEGDWFGYSVSVDGDTVVVGAGGDDTAAGTDAGSVYVFVRSGRTSWNQQVKLTASDGATYDLFGFSVSVDGNIIVVGAPQWNTNKPGSAYVYIRNGPLYSLGAKLHALDDFENAAFGNSVAVSLTRQGTLHVVVGKPYDTLDNKEAAGSAYVFGFGQLPYIMAIIDDLAILYRQGILDAAQADALIAKLEATAEALDRNDVVAAFSQLRAFINQVNAYINARILSPAQGQTLIDQANDIIGETDR